MKKILGLAFTSIFLISSLCFSQEAQKNAVASLNDFSGGISTKLSDITTPSKYARIAENIRLDSVSKAISKRNQLWTYGTADSTEPITSMHRLYLSDTTKILMVTHGDEIETGNDSTGAFTNILNLSSGDYRWKWITWHNLGIGGDGYNQPVKYDGTSTSATYLGSCLATDAGSGAGPNGTYTYKVSFYTSSYEVLFNVPSNSVTVSDNDINLTGIPIAPDTYLGENITGRKIYRIANGGSTYYLLSNGTIANNTATTLTDSDADGELTATAYPAGTATWTPPKGKFYLIHKNRLFIANNPNYPSRIYYSKDSSHDCFETSTDYFDIRYNDGDEIAGIFNVLGRLGICKTNSWQFLNADGDDPATDWSISDPYSIIGCDAPYSMVPTPIGILYLSLNRGGIYVFNGQNALLKSDLVTPVINDILSSNLNNVTGEYNNNVYYMAYSSSDVGGAVNNRVLVYDIISTAYTIDTLNVNSFCSFLGGDDGGVLYVGASDSGKVYKFKNVSQSVIHRKHSDFTGTFDDVRYIPTSVGGEANSPILEISWDCTIDGWLTELQAKDASINTINDINTHIATATINRPDTGGTYISPVINTTGCSAYDKLYWNETIPTGNDVVFSMRGGASSAACQAAGWTGSYSNPSGTDISALTAYPYTQYEITLSTDSASETPYVTTLSGYTVKFTYNTLGVAAETSIPIHWETGYIDFGFPAHKKVLRKIIVTHYGSNGTLTLTFTNETGEQDSFDIVLGTYPTTYEEYFTNGAFTGKKFKLEITNEDLYSLVIKEITLVYDVEPLY